MCSVCGLWKEISSYSFFLSSLSDYWLLLLSIFDSVVLVPYSHGKTLMKVRNNLAAKMSWAVINVDLAGVNFILEGVSAKCCKCCLILYTYTFCLYFIQKISGWVINSILAQIIYFDICNVWSNLFHSFSNKPDGWSWFWIYNIF